MYRNVLKWQSIIKVNECVSLNGKSSQSSSQSMSRSLVSNSSNSRTTNESYFGFEKVSPQEKSRKVFTNVAEKYDLMNDVMSAGIHRIWKKQLIATLDPYCGSRLIDVCGGTGDIAFAFVDHCRQRNDTESRVVVTDINAQMLRVGERRAQRFGYERSDAPSSGPAIEWVEGDAQCLPFEDNAFDAYTTAFGIRNVVHIDRALHEAYRVLRSGSVFLCLEFSHLQNPLFQSIYDWYSFQMIPLFGEIFARDFKSYQYLVESIRRFPDQNDFKQMIESAGFSSVSYTNLMQGIAAIHVAYKK